MSDRDQHFWDILTVEEAESAEALMRALTGQEWAQPLLRDIELGGGLSRANKARFFELRFGYALDQTGIALRYEVQGEGDSSVDFGFTAGGREFLVELMRLEETEAVRAATDVQPDQDGVVWAKRILTTNADDRRQSEEGETVKAVERICQKFERDGRPHKFPEPHAATHILLVDFRTFLNGGDEYDRVHVALGGELVTNEMCRRYWDGRLISGVFSPRTTLRGAAEARARLHFLGFVNEKSYAASGFTEAIQFIANPNLFGMAEEARAAMDGWPLQPLSILNAPRLETPAPARPGG